MQNVLFHWNLIVKFINILMIPNMCYFLLDSGVAEVLAGANPIKTFYGRNLRKKLECLSLESLSSLV